jgi:WD40 repeat protein
VSQDKTLKVWDLDTGQMLHTLKGHSKAVNAAALTPDGKRVLSTSWDKTVKVWDLSTGRALRTLRLRSRLFEILEQKLGLLSRWNEAGVGGVAVTPDGKRAVSASLDEKLKVWDLSTGRTLRMMGVRSSALQNSVRVVVSPRGELAVSTVDSMLKVWSLLNGRLLRTLNGHTNKVNAVVITPDGKRAVSASDDKTLKVWDLETGKVLRTLEGHSDEVNAAAVMPNGRRALSASTDKTLKVWDLDTGYVVATFHCDAAARCCSCSDQRVVAGDTRGLVYIFSFEETGPGLSNGT